MLFQKIKIKSLPRRDCPTGESLKWYMIIREIKDIVLYFKLENELIQNALLQIPESITRSHLDGPRESVLYNSLTLNPDKLKPNLTAEKLLSFVDDFQKRRITSFLEMLEKDWILIQNNGLGCCSYKKYLETWPDNEIIDQIEKDSVYFPTDENYDSGQKVLFLENNERLSPNFERRILKETKLDCFKLGDYSKTVLKLTNLKARDPKFIFNAINNIDIIAIKTELVDKIQIENMLGIFKMVKRKTIYIETKPEYFEQLKEYPDFKLIEEKHNIILLS